MKGLSVRRANLNDLEVLVQFTLAECAESDGGKTVPTGPSRGVGDPLLCDAIASYYVAQLGDDMVGAMCVQREWSDWRGKFFLSVAFVFVVPACRGSGVFRAMWARVIADQARSGAFCEVRLQVHRANARALSAYERAGCELLPYVSMRCPLPAWEPRGERCGRDKTVEVCCDSLASVHAALAGGAKRIEVCSSLSEGGLTPSGGFVRAAAKLAHEQGATCFVLVRCRGGSCCYTEEEHRCMLDDVVSLRSFADGFVVGELTTDGAVAVERVKALVAAADGLPCTFSRAFDAAHQHSVLESLEMVVATGCVRLLTSGRCDGAAAGLDTISNLVGACAGRSFSIMAGAGISPSNAAEIVAATGVWELHGSFRGETQGRPAVFKLGSNDGDVRVTSSEAVAQVVAILTSS